MLITSQVPFVEIHVFVHSAICGYLGNSQCFGYRSNAAVLLGCLSANVYCVDSVSRIAGPQPYIFSFSNKLLAQSNSVQSPQLQQSMSSGLAFFSVKLGIRPPTSVGVLGGGLWVTIVCLFSSPSPSLHPHLFSFSPTLSSPSSPFSSSFRFCHQLC